MNGGTGNDNLVGGAGDDELTGGGGDFDVADYRPAEAGVAVSLARSAAQNTIGAGFDTLSEIKCLFGSAFADLLFGDGFANVIKGGGGSDFLDGGIGGDTLEGEAGDDLIIGGLATVGSAPTGNNSFANAFDLSPIFGGWTTGENPLVADDTIPHLTIHVAPDGSGQEYFRITIGAGQTLTIDVDCGGGTLGGDFRHRHECRSLCRERSREFGRQQ